MRYFIPIPASGRKDAPNDAIWRDISGSTGGIFVQD
jgi:hypothetical protein